ncbi:MAG TPA: lipid-A-disaccharide synthase N-terminal domain-containing protein [Thermoanaerobaculia bacterium]|nr:lipid-A-disaccharide synthase N-terminal domain-containing protein [Thermoanaerobaculia bacterium]HUM28882.1 lipid-A-disaccharide synthase N-terminal domain-containing protein [Thermoanaerobaculia bacterium]HXK67185.1 lipid-A-disaccharide synthase N-terminal domain-containing protein [Thermoanaerobaculia bacterium]
MKMNFWLIWGFIGQACFFSRFLIQWMVSEKEKRSVIPVQFWYFSLIGGSMLLVYAIQLKDPVFILGQAGGAFIYLRNLMLIYRNRGKESDSTIS